MADDGARTLAAQLGAKPPAGIAGLDAEHLRDLAEAVHEARRMQAAELAAASERAYGQIPRLLRGPIRRIFG
jgi:hypothetical protein